MAAKRGKKQARRKDEPSVPGYVWLLAGLLIGGAVAVTAWVKMPHGVDDLLPHPNPAAQPPTANASPAVPEGNPPPIGPKKPKFDFYAVLPEREVVIPDEELSAQVKAEAAANLASKQQAALASGAASGAASPGATTNTANTPGTSSTPNTSNPTNTAANVAMPSASGTKTTNTAATASAGTSPSTPPTAIATNATNAAPASTDASEPKSGQYLLQAGAFRNNEQADDLKARIAMLGLIGHVETVQTPSGEMHRVRLGPYATASELEAAKQKLSGGG
ncbi:MAG TPA: SPOR domain-containing protein, partial [Xanthomonadaceae bacterium]|nr:SPOR domain-containing protein [Xanthomonadaceae bacterium]